MVRIPAQALGPYLAGFSRFSRPAPELQLPLVIQPYAARWSPSATILVPIASERDAARGKPEKG